MKMRYLLLFAGAFVSYFVIGQCLQCYSIPLTSSNDVVDKIDCNATEECFKRIGFLPQKTFCIKGCIASALCSLSYSKKVEGVMLTFRTLCCNTDLCNGSFRIKTSPLAGFVLAVGWSLWHL